MSHGLGNPHRLLGAATKRERLAWEQIRGGVKCGLRSCRYDAIGLIQRWDGSLGYACAIHLDEGERRGYPVLRDALAAASTGKKP